MKRKYNISKQIFRCHHIILASIFSVFLGSLITVNFAQINKTCKIEDRDREHNIMKNSKLKNDELIVLIFSAPENLSKRNTIRLTWLKPHDTKTSMSLYTFSHYFVIGKLGLSKQKYEAIINEQSLYDDILLLPMYEGYNNLTEKVLKSFIWLKEQRDIGFDFEYILKCDDDTYVKINDILHEISVIENFYLHSNIQLSDSNNDKFSPYLRANLQVNKNVTVIKKLNLYWGYFTGKTHLKTSGKWKENNWIICDNYVPYALGGGYVLSKELVLYLAKNEEILRRYNSEDVSVGAWLGPLTNILRVHDVRFDTEWTSRGCQNNHLVTHHIPEKLMHQFYYNLRSTGQMCPSETLNRVPYLYNWNNRPSQCCNDLLKKSNFLDNIMSFFPVGT